VLGFMTKFVAVIFLPVIALCAAALHQPTRRKLMNEWRVWAQAARLALVLIVPWVAYAQYRVGNELWQVMLRDHIFTRFTPGLGPEHLRPWHYYLSSLVDRLVEARVLWLVGGGLLIVAVQLAREWSLRLLVLAGWMVPLALISTGSSKLYHYTYPFLP